MEDIGFGGLRLIQDTEGFRYGIDAVILADFAHRFCPQAGNAVDLGSGNGIIPLILSHKNKELRITGVELQESAVRLAEKNCLLNSLDGRINFYRGDVSKLDSKLFEKMSADMVTCNPPYFVRGGGIPSSSESRFIARHETTAGVEDFIRAAALILGGRGDFFMIHRPSRLVDIFFYCRKHELEPKDIRYVLPKKDKVPNLVLLHCVAGGGRELKMMDSLCVYGDDGNYSDEIMRIYERV